MAGVTRMPVVPTARLYELYLAIAAPECGEQEGLVPVV